MSVDQRRPASAEYPLMPQNIVHKQNGFGRGCCHQLLLMNPNAADTESHSSVSQPHKGSSTSNLAS